ncbi:MAG: hypothetical protein RPS47_09450 [Colwellia sp.]
MIKAEHLRDYIVRPTIKRIGMWSPAAENILIGTIYQESRGGYYLHQLGNGPALGVYQIEPATHNDVWKNYLNYRDALAKKVKNLAAPGVLDEQLIVNLSYATAIARIIYYRKPSALPAANDVQALGEYWKEHYNTEQGKGTVEEFVKNFPVELLHD